MRALVSTLLGTAAEGLNVAQAEVLFPIFFIP